MSTFDQNAVAEMHDYTPDMESPLHGIHTVSEYLCARCGLSAINEVHCGFVIVDECGETGRRWVIRDTRVESFPFVSGHDSAKAAAKALVALLLNDREAAGLRRAVAEAANAYDNARLQEQARLAGLKIAIRAAAGFRPDEIGDMHLTAPPVMSESEMARVSGLNRMTVRAALGK